MQKKVIIGTRGSELALWQANYTKSLLEERGVEVELKIIQTEGDRTQQWETSFDKLEGKGFFTKELEDALLGKTIDLAVHSHKDLPTQSPAGLMIAGVSQREDPSELMIIRREAVDEDRKLKIKRNARVGTSSPRRKCQLLAFRPDVQVDDLRGNVPTRIRKLRDGQYDAILLAAAGVERLELDLSDLHVEKLPPSEFVPAPAQGVLAWQTRDDDHHLIDLLGEMSDLDVLVRTGIEREVLSIFHGGCQMPLGAYCDSEPDDDDRMKFRLWLSVADSWDQQPKQLYFETFDTDGFAAGAVDHVRAIRPQPVFVTRNLNENDYLSRSLTALGFAVEGKSLIEFKTIRIKELPATDWIFFSSRHAVKYFFSQEPRLGNVKFGCIGTSTSAELRAFGKRADFIGQSTDTKLVGKQFASKAGNSKVLFPIARGSMQSVQQQIIKKENVINLEVYATLRHSQVVADNFQLIVVTSPSNVEAFFEKNPAAGRRRFVAMGEATGKALEKFNVKSYVMPRSFDDLGLLQAILGVAT